MLTTRSATLCLIFSLMALSASQVLVKWRFGAVGLDKNASRTVVQTLSAVATDPGLWVAGFLIVVGAAAWYSAMTRLPLTLMLPVAGCISPLVAVSAHFLLAEPLSLGQLGAILVIACGVVALALLH
jgi:drug/metabolite transporter (DMT)-like permease